MCFGQAPRQRHKRPQADAAGTCDCDFGMQKGEKEMTWYAKKKASTNRNLFNAPKSDETKTSKYGVDVSEKGKADRTYDGIQFASKREMERYKTLLWREKAGEIKELKIQQRFDFLHNDQKVCSYVADFTYLEAGTFVVEDSKGAKTDVYKLKKRMMKIFYGIEIRET